MTLAETAPVPPSMPTGQPLWTGQRLPWDTNVEYVYSLAQPVVDRNDGIRRYRCAKCRLWYPRLRDARRTGEDYAAVDHFDPWFDYVYTTARWERFEEIFDDGVQPVSRTITGILFADAKNLYNDIRNLRVLCQRDNLARNAHGGGSTTTTRTVQVVPGSIRYL